MQVKNLLLIVFALVEQLVDTLHDAIRALQLEDMSNQNMRYTIQHFEELLPVSTSLEDAGNSFARLNSEITRYRESSYRQKHNPVSDTSVESGSVDFF